MSSEQLQYVNIHTHYLDSGGNDYSILNYIIGHDTHFPKDKTISMGIHPWYVSEKQIKTLEEELQKLVNHTNVIAIGECGLDKVCNTPWSLQITVFKLQVAVANKVNKPIIIHCVKAYSEILNLLKEENNKVPVIFHGFNKSKELAHSIAQNGYYLSFGEALQYSRMQEVIKSLPINQVFLETDHSDIRIKEVYKWAEKALDIPLENIKSQIWQNLKNTIDTNK